MTWRIRIPIWRTHMWRTEVSQAQHSLATVASRAHLLFFCIYRYLRFIDNDYIITCICRRVTFITCLSVWCRLYSFIFYWIVKMNRKCYGFCYWTSNDLTLNVACFGKIGDIRSLIYCCIVIFTLCILKYYFVCFCLVLFLSLTAINLIKWKHDQKTN